MAAGAELERLLAARRGHFLLESGHHGDLWLDLDGLATRPARLRHLAAELADRLRRHPLEVVAGPLTGGAFLAQLVAAELDAGFAYAERLTGGAETAAYRVPAALRGGLEGRRVAVVDDVVNAGSAARATLADLRGCGARPVALGALLVLGTAPGALAAEEGLPLVHLAAWESGLWSPPDCPLCAAGVPLEDRMVAE